jgi:hypothetical protein
MSEETPHALHCAPGDCAPGEGATMSEETHCTAQLRRGGHINTCITKS